MPGTQLPGRRTSPLNEIAEVAPQNQGASSFTLKPYKGTYATQCFCALLQQQGVFGSGAVQLAFRREALLGQAVMARLR